MSAASMDRHEFWCRCGGCVEVRCVGSVVIRPACPRCGAAMKEVTFFQFEWHWSPKGKRSIVRRNVEPKTKRIAINKTAMNG